MVHLEIFATSGAPENICHQFQQYLQCAAPPTSAPLLSPAFRQVWVILNKEFESFKTKSLSHSKQRQHLLNTNNDNDINNVVDFSDWGWWELESGWWAFDITLRVFSSYTIYRHKLSPKVGQQWRIRFVRLGHLPISQERRCSLQCLGLVTHLPVYPSTYLTNRLPKRWSRVLQCLSWVNIYS